MPDEQLSPEERPSTQDAMHYADLWDFIQDAAARRRRWDKGVVDSPPPYRVALGRETLELGQTEFQIMAFLDSRPYHAFTRGEIAADLATHQFSVTEEQVDELVSSLRDQLGCFHDYVQSVAHIGYRFRP